ncbi:hypothetical protein ACLKA6_006043 [Drosophila palustris]
MGYSKGFDHRLKTFGDKLPPVIRVYHLRHAKLEENFVNKEVYHVRCRCFFHRLQERKFGEVIHDNKDPSVSTFGSRILSQKIYIDFLERSVDFTFPHVVPDLDDHTRPVKLPA